MEYPLEAYSNCVVSSTGSGSPDSSNNDYVPVLLGVSPAAFQLMNTHCHDTKLFVQKGSGDDIHIELNLGYYATKYGNSLSYYGLFPIICGNATWSNSAWSHSAYYKKTTERSGGDPKMIQLSRSTSGGSVIRYNMIAYPITLPAYHANGTKVTIDGSNFPKSLYIPSFVFYWDDFNLSGVSFPQEILHTSCQGLYRGADFSNASYYKNMTWLDVYQIQESNPDLKYVEDWSSTSGDPDTEIKLVQNDTTASRSGSGSRPDDSASNNPYADNINKEKSSNIWTIPEIDNSDDTSQIASDKPNTTVEIDSDVNNLSREGFGLTGYQDEMEYFNSEGDAWNTTLDYMPRTLNAITGMPVQFMANTDARLPEKGFGRNFSEFMLYDAPIAVIQPGAPALNKQLMSELGQDEDSQTKFFRELNKAKVFVENIGNADHLESTLKSMVLEMVAGKGTRFYGFQSQWNRAVQYINTLDHLFITYLGIADDIDPWTGKKYKFYTDYDPEEIKTMSDGMSVSMMYGNYPALLLYYQPDSSLSNSFQNSTKQSSITSKMNEVSDYVKEMSFLMGGLGISNGSGVTVGESADIASIINNMSLVGGNSLVGRIFSSASEGVGTIIAGNNLAMPEIYSDSNMSGTDYTLVMKLVNPYGSPEGAFLFQLRQLARVLAISLPRQFGPNGYTAPFIIRAFSKGQFNVQLGIVESLSIRRGGDGGSNRTIHGIPMELEVTLNIKDLYQQIALSNEYTRGLFDFNNLSNISQIFNNVGLLDFIASYTGFNMNSPAIDMQFDYLKNAVINNLTDFVDVNGTADVRQWKFPKWTKLMNDSFMDAWQTQTTWLAR